MKFLRFEAEWRLQAEITVNYRRTEKTTFSLAPVGDGRFVQAPMITGSAKGQHDALSEIMTKSFTFLFKRSLDVRKQS